MDCHSRLRALCRSAGHSYNGGESLKAVPMPPAIIVIIHCACLEASSYATFCTTINVFVGHALRCMLMLLFCKESASIVAQK